MTPILLLIYNPIPMSTINHCLTVLQALPDDLKTKLSLDEDLVSSPKEALSRASADRVAMRNKNMTR